MVKCEVIVFRSFVAFVTGRQVVHLHLGPGDYVELQFLVDQAGAGLREVTLVQNQTVTTEAARTTEFLEPLCPLWIQLAIGLFILRFKDANDFLWREEEKA